MGEESDLMPPSGHGGSSEQQRCLLQWAYFQHVWSPGQECTQRMCPCYRLGSTRTLQPSAEYPSGDRTLGGPRCAGAVPAEAGPGFY